MEDINSSTYLLVSPDNMSSDYMKAHIDITELNIDHSQNCHRYLISYPSFSN
jgi:hypothetical protein